MLKTRLWAAFILLVGVLLCAFVYYSETKPESKFGRFPFVLGLDLKGGTHLVYRADTGSVKGGDVADSMESLRQVIERRVNIFGVSEPLVQVEHAGIVNGTKDERLIVELPGVTDIDAAVKAIGETPTLEFKLLNDGVPPTELAELAKNNNQQFLASFTDTGLSGQYLDKAILDFDQNTQAPLVSLQFNDEGKRMFSDITKNHVGKYLAIFLDGALIEMPVIREEIPNGRAQISGGFTPDTAKALVRNLNYGALPVPVNLISTQVIGASLGETALHKSIMAGLIGFAIVAIFLIVWYRLQGLIAVIALAIYSVIMLALFKFVPVTLTTAGLAGFILSIGMAVDANILIFERTKEELRMGKKLGDAIQEGFARAWPSIRDSNTSSMITAIILYWLAASPVIKGFALVFFLGVLASMFTAVTASRLFLYSLGFNMERRGGLIGFLFSSGFSK